MTRQFATTATSVWDDEDWWELDGEQQRVFIMLYTQKDITAAGTLPLTLGRWANSTKGCTIEGLSQALRELSDAHYVVVDWRRELLLVPPVIMVQEDLQGVNYPGCDVPTTCLAAPQAWPVSP